MLDLTNLISKKKLESSNPIIDQIWCFWPISQKRPNGEHAPYDIRYQHGRLPWYPPLTFLYLPVWVLIEISEIQNLAL